MVHKCCISSCGMSVRVTGSKGLSFHAFPVKEPNREKWLQAVLPHVDKPEMFRIVQGYTRICSRHFKKKDYSLDSRKRARLSSSAVPSGFPGRDIKDAIQPIRLERKERYDNSCTKSAVTIFSIEKIGSQTLVTEALHTTSVEEKDFCMPTTTHAAGSAGDQQSQQLSEDDTASSAFSSQEECYISRQQTSSKRRSSDKVRKRRKHRVSHSLPIPLNAKKRSSANEDLNIEGVGDALAEITLSALMTKSTDLIQSSHTETQIGGPSTLALSTPFRTIKVEPLFLRPLEPVKPKAQVSSSSSTTILRPASNEGTFVRSCSPKKECLTQANFEHDLLMSIQAVSIGPSETPDPQSPRGVTPTPEVDSVSLNNFLSSTDDDESFVSSHLHDLYADLVNGGASLSLEDSTATIFDSQLLIDALQGVVADLQGDASIDQLARDLDDSFLNDALAPSSILGIDDFAIADLGPFTSTLPDPDTETTFNATKIIRPDKRLGYGDVKVETVAVPNSPTAKCKPDPETAQKRVNDESESSPEFDELSTPTRSRKKLNQKGKASGSFSVERFRDSDKDIEYYTGFSTFEKFNSFFSSIESYVENLKVTDMVYGVANMGLNVSPELPTTSATTCDATLDPAVDNTSNSNQEPKRRLSQGRSMSRMDEMFMTIVRLRRKIPEKVIGHMFCISQPSVSRIIRAWTMLLSKILELGTDGKFLCSKTNQQRLGGSNENTSEAAASSHVIEGHGPTYIQNDDIPASFRQLFFSELAQSIICSGTAALNSRKTSSSTKCPNTSRSKRPKKEKVAVTIGTDLVPPSLSSQDVSINDKFNTILSPSVDSGPSNERRHSDSDTVALVVVGINAM